MGGLGGWVLGVLGSGWAGGRRQGQGQVHGGLKEGWGQAAYSSSPSRPSRCCCPWGEGLEVNRLLFSGSGEWVTGEGRALFPSTKTKTLTSSLCEVRWTERGGRAATGA